MLEWGGVGARGGGKVVVVCVLVVMMLLYLICIIRRSDWVCMRVGAGGPSPTCTQLSWWQISGGTRGVWSAGECSTVTAASRLGFRLGFRLSFRLGFREQHQQEQRCPWTGRALCSSCPFALLAC